MLFSAPCPGEGGKQGQPELRNFSTTPDAQVNMTYNFSATQNNGRIVSSADGVTGENVSYTYDSLNRLIAAATTNPTGPIWATRTAMMDLAT